MHPKVVLACPAGITSRISRDASLPLQSLGPMWWLSLLLGHSSQDLLPPPHPKCKTTSCTLQRLTEMPRVVFGAHLPSTRQETSDRSPGVPTEGEGHSASIPRVCPKTGNGTLPQPFKRDELPERFSSRFFAILHEIFSRAAPETWAPQRWASTSQARKPRVAKDRRQPGERASINKFYGNPQLLYSC